MTPKKKILLSNCQPTMRANTNDFITNKSELEQQKTIHSILAANDEQLHKHIANVKSFLKNTHRLLKISWQK